MAQPRKNGGKILSVIAAILFAIGSLYYGILLFDSFRMMRYTIRETADGLVLMAKGLPPRSIPYLVAIALLAVFAAVQITACFRPAWGMIASLSALMPVLFPLFTDVALAEFTRVGWVYPASLIKYIPFAIACLLWLVRGIFFPESRTESGT